VEQLGAVARGHHRPIAVEVLMTAPYVPALVGLELRSIYSRSTPFRN